MEVPEESNAQIAKRKAIQEVMRDSSLTPQQRQQKIREIMSAAAKPKPTPAPAPASQPEPRQPSPPPPSVQTVQSDAYSQANACSAATVDTRATTGTDVATNAGDSNAPSVQDAAPVSASDARQMMVAIMRDPNLTAQEKQRRVQQVMKSANESSDGSSTGGASSRASSVGVGAGVVAESRRSRMQQDDSTVGGSTITTNSGPGNLKSVPSLVENTKRRFQNNAGSRATPGAVGVAGIGASGSGSVGGGQAMSDSEIKRRAAGGRSAAVGNRSGDAGSMPSPPSQQRTQIERDNEMKASLRSPNRSRPGRDAPRHQQQGPGAHGQGQSAPMVGAQGSQEPDIRTATKMQHNAARHAPATRSSSGSTGLVQQPRQVAAGAPRGATHSTQTDPAQVKQAALAQRNAEMGMGAGQPGPPPAPAMRTQPMPNPPLSSHEILLKQQMLNAPNQMPMHQPNPGYASVAPSVGSTAVNSTGAVAAAGNIEMGNLQNKTAALSQQRAAANEMQQFERDILGKSADSVPDAGNLGPPLNQISVQPPLQSQQPPPSQATSSYDRSIPSAGANGGVPQEAPVAGTSPTTENDAHPSSAAPTMEGVEDGGIQAFVADTAVEAMGVAVVMSEQEEEELDDRKRRQLLCRIGAVICTIAIAVIVVLVVVFTGGDSSGGSSSVAEVPSNSPTDTPTGSPTSMLFAETLEVFKAAYANDDMYNAAFSSKDTPQFKAAEWATGEGSAGLSSTDPRMLARYALATLYFSTQGDEWTTCGRDATKCARTEWLTNDNECDWFAIQCDDGVINNLFFPPSNQEGNNLVGTLPFELAFLTNLELLVIQSERGLTGPIPVSWSPRLTNLQLVLMGGNSLSGSFPSLLVADNPQLERLSLSSNKFSGSLSGLGVSAPALKTLMLSVNEFTGTIPGSISNLPNLRNLQARSNDLRGPIPDDMYDLKEMRILYLQDNPKLSGSISEDIVKWPELEELQLQETGIGGALPLNLFKAQKLEKLFLHDAKFSGAIPDAIAQLVNLRDARLNNNTFSGAIPATLEQLTPVGNSTLSGLRLHGNNLVGNISQAICDAKGTRSKDLQFLTADCAGDDPEVFCDCCEECY